MKVRLDQARGLSRKGYALNDSSCLRCLGTLSNGPSSHFIGTTGEVSDELQRRNSTRQTPSSEAKEYIHPDWNNQLEWSYPAHYGHRSSLPLPSSLPETFEQDVLPKRQRKEWGDHRDYADRSNPLSWATTCFSFECSLSRSDWRDTLRASQWGVVENWWRRPEKRELVCVNEWKGPRMDLGSQMKIYFIECWGVTPVSTSWVKSS